MMSSLIKKKRVSKKKKISWRKNVNITDVEEFLEDKRLEERLGPPLSSIADQELFTVDIKPTKSLLTKKEKALLKLQNPKCFASLKPMTKVPDPITKRNRVRTKDERKSSLLKKKLQEKRDKGILKAKEIQALKDTKLEEMKRRNKPKRGQFDKDLWDLQENQHEIEYDEWATNNTKKHNLAGVGLRKKSVPKSLIEKKSVLPSVEPPHPGMSYNPSFKDHLDLLQTIGEKETKIIKEEKHLSRVTRGMFRKVTENQRDTDWMQEMSEGLPDKSSNENKEDNFNESDNEYKAVNPPVQNKKKTEKQRRKQKEQQQLQLARKTVKVEKKKVTDIQKIDKLSKVIHKKESESAINQEKRKKAKQLKEKEVKRLGTVKFEEPELEFNLGQDISGNLRNIKKEGNLLLERFKSLQKRNILQPTSKQIRKKSKVKKYTKPGHKDDWKKSVARKFK